MTIYIHTYILFPFYRGHIIAFALVLGNFLRISPYVIYFQKLRSLACIFITNNMGLTLIGLTQLSTKATEFDEIMQNDGYYGVQGHSRSPIDFGTNQKPVCEYIIYVYILTYIHSRIVSKLLQIIGQIFAFYRRCLSLMPSFGVIPEFMNTKISFRKLETSFYCTV